MTKNPATSSDIFSLPKQRVGYEFPILHPGTGKAMGLSLTIQSMKSEPVKAILKTLETEGFARRRRNKPLTVDEVRENAIRIMLVVVTGWRWHEDADGNQGSAGGEQLPFTPENLRRILEIDDVRDQIDEELKDEANFFKN